MRHRHLNHENYTLAAIDDIIARGRRADWEALRSALIADHQMRARIHRVCAPHRQRPQSQRYQFWINYVEALPA